MDETLTRKQLKRRRELAIKELLYVYREEYARTLSSLSTACHSCIKLNSPTTLTESQKRVLNARYEEFIKGRMSAVKLDTVDTREMERLGIPVACGTRVEMKGNFLTYAQAEAYVARQMSTALHSTRLEPTLSSSSSSPFATTDDPFPLNLEKKERMRTRSADATKTAEIQRLESIACSSCFRDMDRQDLLVVILGRCGKFSIKQSAFSIGCRPVPVESEKETDLSFVSLTKDITQFSGRKRKADGDGISTDIDVDLSMEGCVATDPEVYAHVWCTSKGDLLLESTGVRNVSIDQKKVSRNESVRLGNLVMVGIGNTTLMIVLNLRATNRIRKRSQRELNI